MNSIQFGVRLSCYLTGLAVFFTSGSLAEQPAPVNAAVAMHWHLRSNNRLSMESANYLPAELVHHLQLSFASDGFSRQVGRLYILATNRQGIGFTARAAVALINGTNVRWKPLSLPFFSGPGRFASRDQYGHIAWDDEKKTLQVRECSDLVADHKQIVCIKHFFRIEWGEATLVRLDVQRTLPSEWITIWETGKGWPVFR